MPMDDTGRFLESTYNRLHKPCYISPDPLETILGFTDVRDREIAALVASALALGRVTAIIDAVYGILRRIPKPYDAVRNGSLNGFLNLFPAFTYRFFTSTHIAHFLHAVSRVVNRFGSLESAFKACSCPDDDSIETSLGRFCGLLHEEGKNELGILIPRPEKKSACKRMFLFLRWMVRQDGIDPGGWRMDPADLMVPVDTHMLQVARMLGFTCRKQADLAASREITRALRRYDPRDPVRFDFSLTRPGIRPELSLVSVVAEYNRSGGDGARNPGVSADHRAFPDDGLSA